MISLLLWEENQAEIGASETGSGCTELERQKLWRQSRVSEIIVMLWLIYERLHRGSWMGDRR